MSNCFVEALGEICLSPAAAAAVSPRPAQRGEGSVPTRHGYAWNPRILVATESAEQAWTPAAAPECLRPQTGP